MQRECVRCKKLVATEFVLCECNKLFHPGCVKVYFYYKYASQCCRDLAVATFPELRGDGVESITPSAASTPAPLTPGVECTELLDFSVPACTSTSKSVTGDTTNALLRQLVERMKSTEERFSAFAESSEARLCELSDKLNQLNCLAKSVDRNTQRITELEQQCTALTNQVRGLKGELKGELMSELKSELKSDPSDSRLVPRSPSSRVLRTSDIIISGFPCSRTDTSLDLVTSVFRALNVSQLASDVLETRDVGGGGVSAVHGVATASVSATDRAVTGGRVRSVIVVLKSREIRDHILTVMRRKRRLTVSEVFSTDVPGHIYVNELLPSDVYKLLRRTRVEAKRRSYKHVWCRDGQIFVRKDLGQSPVLITAEADLAELE